jgi:hypothetical protein
MMRKILLSFLCLLAITACQKKDREYRKDGIYTAKRPKSAEWKIEGVHHSYCLWYDPNLWMIFSNPIFNKEQKDQEWLLVLLKPEDRKVISQHSNFLSTAFIFSYDETNRSIEEIKQRVTDNFIKYKDIQEFKDLGAEERIINGRKVWMWRLRITASGLGSQVIESYYFTSEEGSVSLVTLTSQDHWEEYREAIEDLLNGFCMSAGQKLTKY